MRSRPRERAKVNLARLALPALRLVVLCDELGSLSAAAPSAHMSLSGASHKLASIEAALGFPLFVREPRGLKPTAAGRLVSLHARGILRAADALLEALDGQRPAAGDVAPQPCGCRISS